MNEPPLLDYIAERGLEEVHKYYLVDDVSKILIRFCVNYLVLTHQWKKWLPE